MKSTARISIGAILFVAFIAITWAVSNNGLKAQPLNEPSPPSMVIQSSAPVEAKSSRPVSELPTGTAPRLDREINTLRNPGLFKNDLGLTGTDTNKQDALVALSQVETGTTAPPLFTFEGLGTDGYTPPDTVGEVGPNHYVQMVNISFQIFDKTGNTLQADTAFTELFAGSGLTACASENDGDPVVVYDELADRWLLSQFAVSSGERMCIAISQTPDPTGSYWLYQFDMPDFPDYFKFGVWSDAYYMSTNTGAPNQYYAYAFDRAAMLAGNPATFQYSDGHPNFMMPADLDGATPPPAGSPGYFYTMLSDGYPDHPSGVDRLAFYEFDVDWATPANSTFTMTDEFAITPYNYTVCGFFVGDCIDQPGTAQGLDSLSYWPMFRFGYRNLGSYEALVGNFTVDLDGTDKAAIRWFELQNTGSGWGLYQEGTHAPDSDHRWMGSIAMDASGNIGLGYSVSSDTTIPEIRYATRLRTDPLSTLQAEETMYASSGVHTDIHRWGDYSALSVDPADGCTFWYTNQYDSADNAGFDWQTRIGTFTIPGCTGSLGPDFSLSATPANQAVCTPTDAVYDIALDYVSGFDGSVALSAVNVPAGTTAVINPSSVVTPTMSSMMTLTVGATAPGSYDISIVGVAVPTPTHTTTVGLDVYDAVPSAITLVTPADVATDIDLLPTLTWTADAQGNSYEVQVATDIAFTTIVYTDSLGATSSTVDVSLSPLTTYYWRVYGNNACGDGAWSAIWSFTTREIPPILLVDDDDNNPDVRSYYTNALDALGAQYDIWDTNNTDTEPSAAELAPYSTVIWFTGDEFGGAAGPGAAGETALATWLDGGKCLFITSQDYYYDRGQTAFMTDYLGLASATSDNGDYTSVTGQGTVFSGYGPYALDYGPVGTDYSDPLTPDGTAEVAFLGNNSNNAAIDKDSGVYRTTFWGYSYEAISTAADREEAMGVVLDWCGNGVDTGTLDGRVTDADSGLGIEGATVTAVSGTATRSVSTDVNGDYSVTAAVDVYDVTVEATNYYSETVMGASVITDTTTTVNFDLDWSAAIVSVDPNEIEVTLVLSHTLITPLTILNSGALSTTFSISELPGGYVTTTLAAVSGNHETIGNPATASESIDGSVIVGSAGSSSAIALTSQPFAPTSVLHDNGSLVTHPAGGAGGLDASALQTNLGIANYGFGHQFVEGNRIADDFVIDVPWTIDSITFFAYQSFAGTSSTITGVYLQIWDGPPNDPGSSVIFGDTTTNRMVNTAFSDIYRVLDTDLTNSDRAIMANTADLGGITLPPGTYWLDWMTDGSAASGPWAPPVSVLGSTGTGNAMQYVGAWADIVDVGPQDFPFVIEGTANGDIPWLSEDPITGTVGANNSTSVNLIFDSTTVTQTGTYSGTLRVLSNDPLNGVIEIPVTMHVVESFTLYLPVIMKP